MRPFPRRPATRRVRLLLGGLAAVLAGLLSVTGSTVLGQGGGSHGGPLTVTASACGSPARHLAAGPVAFEVTDRAPGFAQVYLVSQDGALAYAEIPWLASAHTLPLTGTLGAGRYAVRCVLSDGTVRTSRPFQVTGRTTGALRGYRPLPDLQLTPAVQRYRAWVDAALPGLVRAARTLSADLDRGDLRAARADWLPAHLDYERLGAAYGSFGDFDGALDGAPGGLPKGTADPSWTGFLRIEYGLWHGQSAAGLRPLGRRLVSDAEALAKDFPSEDIDPGNLPLRTHEILENALEFQLSGRRDFGSHTVLATLDANAQGTGEVLAVLAPLITPRDPGLLARSRSGLTALRSALAADRARAGGWPAPAALPTAERAGLEARLDGLLEQLARVPDLLASRSSA
ncbi:EfeM/EfeO family lipoprotein [Actinacidiphila yeochonensis]|uniref:EfeM/EfeO family lipoprotein n=1 Tax=Actinacidiphila yeochonensis TaxID=89050 RepID=UPI00068ABD0D|nr:EfeM/EfeO family lipoprotein [Actinacidiphila yeochonensis]